MGFNSGFKGLIKHCTLPLRVYNCIGILLVFIVDDPCEEGTESDAVRGNLVPQHEQAVHSQSCGKINVINLNTVIKYHHVFHTESSSTYLPS